MTIKMQIPFSATHFHMSTGFWWREPNITQKEWAKLFSSGWKEIGDSWRGLSFIPVRSLDPAHFENPKTVGEPKVDAVAWDGKGLPPVGTVCEGFCGKQNGDRAQTIEWQPVRVIHLEDRSDRAIALRLESDSPCWIYGKGFRPIKTPEQIEAEEREIGVDGIRQAVSKSISCKANGLEWDIACAIYDAGYRKQVKS